MIVKVDNRYSPLDLNAAGDSLNNQTAQSDQIGHVETRGIDFIPEAERHSSPLNVFVILVGASLTFGLIVVGALPISFGLGWWPAFWSVIIGAAIGSFMLAPVALVGPRTGTNGPVSSGAFFGVVGRMLGSALGLMLSMGFYALAVWTGGQVAVASLGRLLGIHTSSGALGISYFLIAAASSIIAIYGHASMVLAERLMLPIAGLLLLLGLYLYAPHFTEKSVVSQYLLGAFWPTWGLAVTIAAVTVYGYAPLVSDWTRYISPVKYSKAAVSAATWAGGFVGISLPLLFGAFIALAAGATDENFVPAMVAISPVWYLAPLIVVGTVGSLGQATVCLYSCGLDLSSIIPSLKRPMATIVLSVAALALVYLGTFVASIETSLTGFLQILGVATASWIAIVVCGHFQRREIYNPADLQVFNRGETGGIYWFTGGWNLRALTAFVIGTAAGALALQCTLYTGPLSNLAGGVDLSWVIALLLSGALYLMLVRIFPESLAS